MAAGWDGRAHLSKALWIGLAVDERGNEVGEAFAASMRVGFCTVVGFGGPSVFGGDLSRSSFGQAGDITISRSARDYREQVLSAVSVLVRCLHLHITAAHTHRSALENENVRSLLVTTVRTPSSAYSHSASSSEWRLEIA